MTGCVEAADACPGSVLTDRYVMRHGPLQAAAINTMATRKRNIVGREWRWTLVPMLVSTSPLASSATC